VRAVIVIGVWLDAKALASPEEDITITGRNPKVDPTQASTV